MSCPRCNSENVIGAGFVVTKTYNKRYRWKCVNCKSIFIVNPISKFLDDNKVKEIIRLSKRINYNASKNDHRRRKYYSSKIIAMIMNINVKTVKKILRQYRILHPSWKKWCR